MSGDVGAGGGDPAADAAAQLVEVVDLDGQVLEIVTRARMRAERLRHRCTYVLVVDSQQRLVVHQRAPWKDVWPGRWDVAFGGVVEVGEDWGVAAQRELLEEAGIQAGLQALGAGAYDDGDVSVLGHLYLARHDGPFTFPDGEVVASDRVGLDDLEGWIGTHALCLDSVALAVGAFGELLGPPPPDGAGPGR
ncbi:MAG: NUDIX domain-containing protein [Acidimicrobiales bacterium]|nr:NUDIX domain-containing protein [Acidimicrobiales bacterium]